MNSQREKSSEPAPIISHEEIHAKIPSISQHVSNQDHAYYRMENNQPGADTSSATVVVQKNQPVKKPKDFVNFSCFVILGCNFCFGFLGYHFGQKSNYAWQLGDVDTAKKQAKKALIFNVVGIVLGLLTYTAALVLFFTVFKGKLLMVKQYTIG